MEISSGNKTAIIIGASGLVGTHCLDYLLAHKAYNKVVSIGRKKLEISSDKLEEHVIKFNSLEKYSNLFKGDDLFICLGTTMAKAGNKEAFKQVDYGYVVRIAQMASKNKVNQLLLVSSVGANPDSNIFYNKVKGETEEAIKKLKFWSIHIFQPSILLGERPESRVGESAAKILGKGLDFVLGGLLSKYKPVEAETVAKSMIAIAQNLKSGIFTYPSHFLQKIAEKEDELRKKQDRIIR